MNINDVLNSFNAASQGDYYIMVCPHCGHKEAYCYIDDIKKYQKDKNHKIPVRCNRLNKCGRTSYLNDYLEGVDTSDIVKIKEESPIKMTIEGIKYIQKFCNYVVNLIHGKTNGFDFDIRGISNQTLKKYGIIYYEGTFQRIINTKENKQYFGDKYRSSSYIDRDIIIPIMNLDNEAERLLLRSTFHKACDKKGKDFYQKEIQVMLKKRGLEIWNIRDLFDEDKKIIFVTEGVYDALSILDVAGDENVGAVALPGVGKYKHLIKILKNPPKSWKGNQQDLFNKKFIIAFDNDDAGKDKVKEVLSVMKKEGINAQRLYMKYKDCNEFLQSDRKHFTNLIKKIIGE